MQIESLMQLGFTEKEAMVYLILLRIGPSPASVVANRLDIKRATAYAVLNSLCQQGIVSLRKCTMEEDLFHMIRMHTL